MSDTKSNKETSCGIIPIFVDPKTGEQQFLLVHHHAGHWGFPKGHKESGETYLETAVRELYEETGLICSSIDESSYVFESYFVKRPSRGTVSKTAHYYVGYVNTQGLILQPEEIQAYFWGDARSVFEKISHRASGDLFKRVLDSMKIII